MRWIKASEPPPVDGIYYTDIGKVTFREGFWRKGEFRDCEEGKVTKWLDESADYKDLESAAHDYAVKQWKDSPKLVREIMYSEKDFIAGANWFLKQLERDLTDGL